MTDQEALKYLKDANRNNQMVGVLPKSDIGKCLINALEEIQQYRAIGTVEECREAVEKQMAKKPLNATVAKDGNKIVGTVGRCPSCGEIIDDTTLVCDCGQKMDW